MTEDNMLLAREIAAQCWCEPSTEQTVMDPVLAEAFATRLAGWIDIAKMNLNGIEYYTGLLDQIAKMFGEESYISDDGSVQDTPLRAKMPELVEKMHGKLVAAEARIDELETAVLNFLIDSSWARYGREADAVEMRFNHKDYKVQCGLIPFDELVKALVKSNPTLSDWRERCLREEY